MSPAVRSLLLASTFSLLFPTLSPAAVSYTRFWAGTARTDLSEQSFVASLNEGLLPATGALRETSVGIESYFPVVLPIPLVERGMPSEVALVGYRDEADYAAYRATSAGKAYGDLHWRSFAADRSGSLVPGTYAGAIEPAHAYALANDWEVEGGSSGLFFRVYTRNPRSPDGDYYRSVAAHIDHVMRFRPLGFSVSVQTNAVYEYVLWGRPVDRARSNVTARDVDNWSGRTQILDPLVERTGRIEFEARLERGTNVAPGTGVRYPL